MIRPLNSGDFQLLEVLDGQQSLDQTSALQTPHRKHGAPWSRIAGIVALGALSSSVQSEIIDFSRQFRTALTRSISAPLQPLFLPAALHFTAEAPRGPRRAGSLCHIPQECGEGEVGTGAGIDTERAFRAHSANSH